MKVIIRREFLERIRSLPFMVLFSLTVLLFAAGALIFVKSNAQKIDAYQKDVKDNGRHPSTRVTSVVRRPNPLLFIAEGGDRARPSGYLLLPKGTFLLQQTDRRTLKLPAVPPLDWSFIIGTLFSLYVILLGYNAISGEREDGTLRLILSNPVGRIWLLVSKYLSILLAMTAPLLAGALVSLIIIGSLAPQVLTPANLAAIALTFVVALAFVSLFAFLSLLFSALISRSSLVLLALLAVWVLFGVIIPSSSAVLMEKLSAAPRDVQAARMLQPTIQKEVWSRIEDIGKRSERGEFKSEEEVRTAADQAFEEGQLKLSQFYEDIDRNQRRRLEAARNLARLSPAALFQYAAENLILSGPGGEERFLGELREYSRVYDAYIQKKLGKVVQTSNFMLSSDVTFNGKKISLHSPEPQEYVGDKSDFPVFSERQASVGAGIKSALGDLAGLVLWNIILAGLAFSAFLRTDVR